MKWAYPCQNRTSLMQPQRWEGCPGKFHVIGEVGHHLKREICKRSKFKRVGRSILSDGLWLKLFIIETISAPITQEILIRETDRSSLLTRKRDRGSGRVHLTISNPLRKISGIFKDHRSTNKEIWLNAAIEVVKLLLLRYQRHKFWRNCHVREIIF